MAKVVVSLLAQLDEAYIARGLAREAGQRTAAKYVAVFGGLYVRLGAYPESGAPRPSLGANVRIGIVSPYIVPYRYDSATVLSRYCALFMGGGSLPARWWFPTREPDPDS